MTFDAHGHDGRRNDSAEWMELFERTRRADAERSRRHERDSAYFLAAFPGEANEGELYCKERSGVVVRRIASPRIRKPRSFAPLSKRRTFPFVGVIAAAFLSFAVLGTYRRVVQLHRLEMAPRATDTVYTASRGSHLMVWLTDRSFVRVASGSQLRVIGDWRRERTVEVTGQALFYVQPDERPFVVRTRKSVARVLGTNFLVRAYPDERQDRIVVITGKVAVSPARRLAAVKVVAAGGAGGVSLDSVSTAVSKNENLGRYLNWIYWNIEFRDASLGEVVDEIQRQYDVTVSLRDSAMRASRLSVMAYGHMRVETIFKGIADITGVEFVKVGPGKYVARMTGRAIPAEHRRVLVLDQGEERAEALPVTPHEVVYKVPPPPDTAKLILPLPPPRPKDIMTKERLQRRAEPVEVRRWPPDYSVP